MLAFDKQEEQQRKDKIKKVALVAAAALAAMMGITSLVGASPYAPPQLQQLNQLIPPKVAKQLVMPLALLSAHASHNPGGPSLSKGTVSPPSPTQKNKQLALQHPKALSPPIVSGPQPVHDPKVILNLMAHPKSLMTGITLEAESLNDREKDALEAKLQEANLPFVEVSSQIASFHNVKKGFAVYPSLDPTKLNGRVGYTIHGAYFKIQECVNAILKKNADVNPLSFQHLKKRCITILENSKQKNAEDVDLDKLLLHLSKADYEAYMDEEIYDVTPMASANNPPVQIQTPVASKPQDGIPTQPGALVKLDQGKGKVLTPVGVPLPIASPPLWVPPILLSKSKPMLQDSPFDFAASLDVSEKQNVERMIKRYVVGKGFCGKMRHLLFRVWNAIKSLFGKSEWQIARKRMLKAIALYDKSTLEKPIFVAEKYLNYLFFEKR